MIIIITGRLSYLTKSHKAYRSLLKSRRRTDGDIHMERMGEKYLQRQVANRLTIQFAVNRAPIEAGKQGAGYRSFVVNPSAIVQDSRVRNRIITQNNVRLGGGGVYVNAVV